MRGDAGRRIDVMENEVGACEEFCDQGILRLRRCTCCVRVSGRVMDVEVSHDYVVITEVKKRVKVSCEIGGTTGYRGV